MWATFTRWLRNRRHGESSKRDPETYDQVFQQISHDYWVEGKAPDTGSFDNDLATWVDADDFERALNDPKVHAFWDQVDEFMDKLRREGRDHSMPFHEDRFHGPAFKHCESPNCYRDYGECVGPCND